MFGASRLSHDGVVWPRVHVSRRRHTPVDDDTHRLLRRHALLRVRFEVLHLHYSLAELTLAEDEHDTSSEHIRASKLALERRSPRDHLTANALASQVTREAETRRGSVRAEGRDEH